MRRGAARTEADLTGLDLTSFVLKGGISDLTLTLPEPSGVVPIRLSGGVSKVSIRRPAGAEARLSVKGGAATLTFDEQSFDALGGKVRLQSPGYNGATDRYEIELSGGSSEIGSERAQARKGDTVSTTVLHMSEACELREALHGS